MNRSNNMKLFEIYSQLADLKEVDYKNTLVITALIEILVEKGVIERSEVIEKAHDLDLDHELDIERRKIHTQ